MATYYVDPDGGSDSYDGTVAVFTTGTTGPKATLNGAEDVATSAGDIVWVKGGGVHRYLWTIDQSGSMGSPITYCVDVRGQHWPGGGYTAVTASDDDETHTRSQAMSADTKNYRTFEGFYFEGNTLVDDTVAFIFNDCQFRRFSADNVSLTGTASGTEFHRCQIGWGDGNAIRHNGTGTGTVIHDCVLLGSGVWLAYWDDSEMVRCLLLGSSITIRTSNQPTGGSEPTIEDNVIVGNVTWNTFNTGTVNEDNNHYSDGTLSYTGTMSDTDLGASSETGLQLPVQSIRERFGALPPWAVCSAKDSATSTTEKGFLGTPRVAATTPDAGAIETLGVEIVDLSGTSGANLGPGASVPFWANCVASTEYQVSVFVTGSGTMTTEPLLKTAADMYGVSETTDTATDSESGETLSFTFTPTATGVMEFWVINADGTEDVQVKDIEVAET